MRTNWKIFSNSYKSLFGSRPTTFEDYDRQKKSEFEHLQNYAAHILTHFTFKQSTPNNEISTLLESQFSGCISKNQLSILSTCDVLPIIEIRIPTSETNPFIKGIPVVPQLLLDQCGKISKRRKEQSPYIKLQKMMFLMN